MADKNDYAILSAAVYNNVARHENKLIIPISSWTEIATSPANLIGFGAVAYQNASGEIVIAYKGTDTDTWVSSAADWLLANFGNATGLASIMAVWFDRPAVVFDEVPFQWGAPNLLE